MVFLVLSLIFIYSTIDFQNHICLKSDSLLNNEVHRKDKLYIG